MTTTSTWTSSDLGVATVDPGGLVTGVDEGVATINATVEAISGSTALTVTPPEVVSIAILPSPASVPKGRTLQFSATGTFTDGSSDDVSAVVTWASSNSSVAPLGATGFATGVSEGSTTISATLDGIADSTILTVLPPVLASVVVAPSSQSLPQGLDLQFSAIGVLSDGTPEDRTASAVWMSSDLAVATINTTGLASGIAQRATTISATVEGLTGSTVLTVAPPAPASLEVAPNPGSVPAGLALQLNSVATFTDDSIGDVSAVATWESSRADVATVDQTGLAVGVQVGTTTITATLLSVVGSAVLEVTAPVMVSLTVTPDTPFLAEGSLQFEATGTFSDGSTQDLTATATWASSTTSVATIASSGRALVAGEGVTTITASFGGFADSTELTVPELLPISALSPWALALAVLAIGLLLAVRGEAVCIPSPKSGRGLG